MKILLLFLTFLIPVFVYSQDNRYNIGKNNFAGGFSAASGNFDEGACVVFFMAGYERIVGSPEKNGYFFSGELRARTGMLWELMSDPKMSYSGKTAGLSIAVRPYLEIFEGNFLFLEGEFGYMYEYMTAKITQSRITDKNSSGSIVPQYGVKLGDRAGKLSISLGIYYFNHTRAVNRLIPREYKIVDSREGLAGELGVSFYF